MEQNNHSAAIVAAIEKATLYNQYFRKEMWTGEHLQITVMCIPVGGEVGTEIHENLDQILVLEQGSASVFSGETAERMTFVGEAREGYAVIVPAGTYHNVVNDGAIALKMFSVYAPPKHPVGTEQRTKADADREEN